MKKLAVILLFAAAAIHVCHAQEAAKETQDGGYWVNGQYVESYFKDAGKIITSPSRWNGAAWERAGIIAGIAGGLYAFDRRIMNEFQQNRSGFTNDISNVVTPFGNPTYTIPALGGLYLFGDWSRNVRARKTALLGVESIVGATVFTQFLKYATHRARPYSGLGPDVWKGPELSSNDDFLSFSSEHAAASFALASVVAEEYRDTSYVPPLAYGIAVLVDYSRMNDEKHWASDVFVGSAIGYFTAHAILRLHPGGKNGVSISPSAVGGTPGLSFTGHF